MKNLFITGINGFIGSSVAEHFLNKGYHVIGLVRDINMKSRHEVLNRCSIVRGDILDKELIQSILSKYEVDEIIHLASQPIVRICDNDPYSAYMTNVVGVLNLLESVRVLKKKPTKILCMTSDKYYGPSNNLPYKEEDLPVVADTYCTSKTCQDMIARSYANTYNLPVVVVRAGNIYGPGDLNLSRLIPNTIRRLLNNEEPMLYSGVAEYIREFIYISNVADAFEILLEKGVPGEAYNIGGTKPQKIKDVITLIRDKVNPEIKINIVEKDFYEIKEQYLDGTKLNSLGFLIKTNFEQGIINTIDWGKRFFNVL